MDSHNNTKPDNAASGIEYPTVADDWSYGMPVQSPDLKPDYATIALVQTESDIARLDDDGDTLIVCCDWLLAYSLVAQGRHALYYEAGLAAWPETDNLHTDLLNHTNDWILESGEVENTAFHNVCTGRMFGHELYMALVNYYRIQRALEMLIRTYAPKNVLFFNFQYEFNHLSRKLRTGIVSQIATEHGIAFTDCASAKSSQTHSSNIDIYRQQDNMPVFKAALLGIYTTTIKTATALRRWMLPDDNRVLLLVNSNLLDPLLLGYSGQNVTPVALARSVPRRWRHLWQCFISGILLVDTRKPKLSPEDEASVQRIYEAFERAINGLQGPTGLFIADYLRENTLHTEVLHGVVETILEAEHLLRTINPKRIVVDGVRSHRHTTFTELASAMGIGVDYTWHSPLSPQSLKLGGLGGDPRQPRFVDRCLSWGEANDKWVARTGKDVQLVRVGSPMRRKFESLRRLGKPKVKPIGDTNVLILQYTYTVLDMAGLNASMYGSFVGTIQMLKKLGYRHFRFKLHPGGGRFDTSHFQRIADHFGIECEIHKSTPFRDCLEWADIVIGPLISGAVMETMSAGLPYYAYLLPPQKSVDPVYYEDFPLMHSIDDLPEALQQDNTAANEKLLDIVWSRTEIPDPCKRFWDVLSKPEGTVN